MADEQNESPILPADAPTEAPKYDFEKEGTLKSSVEALMARLGLSKDVPVGGENDAVVASALAEMDAVSGEGEPDSTPTKGQPEAEKPFDPATEDWSKYDLEQNLAHYYPKSQLAEVEEGVIGFIAPKIQFNTKSVSTSTAGDYITEKVNGPEQWQLSALLPNGSGLMVVVLMRKVMFRLPHPTLLETETHTEPVTDEELQSSEDAALSWAGQANPEKQAVLDKIADEAAAQAVTLETAVEGADAENA
jgi:hypothetical protein